ncbi:MAG: lipoyl protein ligase domain-containing protein [bacterium]
MDKPICRFIDTGTLTAAENMALDELLLELRGKNKIPDTIRLLQFNPPAALVGFHQAVDQEIRVDYCKKMKIDINRRITGGGAIYFDKSQIGWEIIGDKKNFGCELANSRFFEKLSLPIINMLKKLGINARFRGRNDIEVSGRKISGTGGAEYNNAFLFQGTLLVDFDVDSMLRALRIPIEKLKRHEIDSLKERVTCLAWELGYIPDISMLKDMIKKSFQEVFDFHFVETRLSAMEMNLLENYAKKFVSEKWVNRVCLPISEQPTLWQARYTRAGKIKIFFVVNLRRKRLQYTIITGDFFAYPREAIFNLEALLKDLPLEKEAIAQKITDYFKEVKTIMIPGLELKDFLIMVDGLFEKLKLIEYGIPNRFVNHIFLVNGTFKEIIAKRPNHLLLPYCAKSTDCKFRYQDACTLCNSCSTGRAYELAQRYKLNPVTITSFESLIKNLKKLKKLSAPAYIGCCCEQFYIKHQRDFETSGLPAILLNINNDTCYDLGKASFAYKGQFESQTDLNINLLKVVLDAL